MGRIAYRDEVLKPHWSSMVSTPPKRAQPPFRIDAGEPAVCIRNPNDSRMVRLNDLGRDSAVTN